MAKLVGLRASYLQNKRPHARSHLSFLDLYPTYHPTGGVQVLQKAWNLLSDDVKAIY
jgi:hypothetical protein